MIRRTHLVGLLVLGLGGMASQASAKLEVYPTGVYPDDVNNVQAAVDKDPDVLLKSVDVKGRSIAFNFGVDSKSSKGHGVVISHDLVLEGETVHGSQTTVQGGFNQVVCAEAVKTEIHGIHFDDLVGAAIYFQKSTGSKIWGNRITRVGAATGGGTTWGRGIWMYGAKYSDLTGHIEISQNSIDDIGGAASYGISVSSCDCDVDISQNAVNNIGLNGILVGANSGEVWITHNKVNPGPSKFKDSVGNGILVGHARGGTYHVIENILRCENPQADGLVIVGSTRLPTANSELIGNDVTMAGSQSSAIGLYGKVSFSTIYGNKIRGAAMYAIQIATIDPKDPVTAQNNTIMGNILAGFKSSSTDLFLDTVTSGTVASGNGGSALDKGAGNTISGFQVKTKPVKS